MTAIINYECNGCGKWSTFGKVKESFNIIKIDLTRYIAFSSGFIPSRSSLEIHFCNDCYCKIQDKQMVYSVDGSVGEILKENQKLERELSDLRTEFRTHKARIADLLRAGE